jgi:hypothetical protein
MTVSVALGFTAKGIGPLIIKVVKPKGLSFLSSLSMLRRPRKSAVIRVPVVLESNRFVIQLEGSA